MTRYDDGYSAAVKAAADANAVHYIRQHWDDYGCSCGFTGPEATVRLHIAEAAVAAAAPILLAAERTRYGALVADLRRLCEGGSAGVNTRTVRSILDRHAGTAPQEPS